jgi:hypothetical protein
MIGPMKRPAARADFAVDNDDRCPVQGCGRPRDKSWGGVEPSRIPGCEDRKLKAEGCPVLNDKRRS